MSLTDQLEAYFRARPNIWIDGLALAGVAGQYAWRSRCADLRKRGMVIDNAQRRVRGHAPTCPAMQAWDQREACACRRPVRMVHSLYRYVPPAVSTVTTTHNSNAPWSLR